MKASKDPPLLRREQVRRLDRIAVERFGIPSLLLMENAGRGAAQVILESSNLRRPPVLAVCGKGNNGGDGFVICRHLANEGLPVQVILLGPEEAFPSGGDAGTNLSILKKMGVAVSSADSPGELARPLSDAGMIVDAILGTGLNGEVRGAAKDAILALNEAGKPILAVDIPSGLDCDAGTPLGVAVRAEETATFAAMKVGFTRPGAQAYTGAVTVVPIGCPLVWR